MIFWRGWAVIGFLVGGGSFLSNIVDGEISFPALFLAIFSLAFLISTQGYAKREKLFQAAIQFVSSQITIDQYAAQTKKILRG